MKKYEDIKTAICPKCGQEYTGNVRVASVTLPNAAY